MTRSIKVPNRTQIIIKGNKLKNEFKSLSVYLFENEDVKPKSKEFANALLKDICSVTKFFNKNEDENLYEYLLTFIIAIECLKIGDPDDEHNLKNIDALDLVSNWEKNTKDVKKTIVDTINNHQKELDYSMTLTLLKKYNEEGLFNDDSFEKIKNALRVFMFNFSYTIISIDGEIDAEEKLTIDKYNFIISNTSSNKIGLEAATIKNINSKQRPLEEILSEIDQLVGMDNVKNEIKQLINFVKVNKLREEKGFNKVEISLHTVFSGPPGTGKTTIARLLAEAFRAIGILKSGHLVETDRAALVAGYVGQTAIKTKEVVESAMDGLLFIDEAYMLSNGDDEFGQEAIDTILKYMEDNRSRLVVIVAGYENEMNEFVESNPGLKSRFNKYVSFEDYSPSELLEIFIRLSNKNKFIVTESAKTKIFNNLADTCINKENFGNARYVRNLFESIVQHQFARVSNIENITDEVLSTIEPEDVVS